MTDRLLIIAVFVVASCGLAYELIAGALSSYLLGDSILQFSTIIGSYLFAMGIGAHLSRYVRDEDAIARFVDIELAIGLFGGLSAVILFLTFAWLAAPFRTLLYGFVLVIGMLVGMEIPLVMRLLGMRKVSLSDLVSRVLTFDYLGALAVSLLFPLVLAPRLGLIRSALLFGLLNVVVALWTIHGFRAQLSAARGQVMRASVILALLLFGFTLSDRLTAWGEHGMFGDEIVHATSTPYQRLVITRWKMIYASISTATCNSPRATSIVITRRWCIQASKRCPGRATCWCLAAAMVWRCVKFCATRMSRTSLWLTSTAR